MMDSLHIYVMQILFVTGITYGSNCFDLTNKHKWAVSIARYVLYILIVNSLGGVFGILYDTLIKNRALDVRLVKKINRHHLIMSIGAILFLLLNEQSIIGADFPLIFVANAIIKYLEYENKSKVALNFGVGMACSYFEGYLVHVIPSDGNKMVGFEENITNFENREGVVFPVKRLFVIVTKSLYNPPDLKHFNKPNKEHFSKLEVCKSLEELELDVAGVRNRIYKNTAYKIYRPSGRPVFLAAECATIIHTLYRVMKNTDLYEELADLRVHKEEIVEEFLTSLRKFISLSPACKDKCEIIYFDDENRELNLADVLLDRIRELEPNFEELIVARR